MDYLHHVSASLDSGELRTVQNLVQLLHEIGFRKPEDLRQAVHLLPVLEKSFRASVFALFFRRQLRQQGSADRQLEPDADKAPDSSVFVDGWRWRLHGQHEIETLPNGTQAFLQERGETGNMKSSVEQIF